MRTNRKRMFRWASACGVLLAAPVNGGVLRVPSDYATIQGAMTAAVSGDSVLVAPGTYTNCDGGPCLASLVVMKSGVTLLSEEGATLTVLRVDTPGGGINMVHGAGIAGAVLKGFTITGTAPGYYGAAFLSCQGILVEDCRFFALAGGWQSGAGLFSNSSSITVRDCEFVECVATQEAAAYLALGGRPVIERCLFESCYRGGVGLAGVTTSSAVVRDCVFRNNTGNAALAIETTPNAEISGTLFVGNSSPQNAVALVVNAGGGGAGSTVLRNNLFAGNVASVNASAAVSWHSSGEIRGNTFWSNSGPYASAVDDISQGGEVTVVSNNIFVGNSGSAAYRADFLQPQASCNLFWSNPGGNYAGHYVPASTDLFVDPLLCDPVAMNFYLMTGSPCLPENSGVCGLIGAFGQGCGPVSVDPASWGRLKAAYR